MFSKRLRELRTSLGLTQREFGVKSGISPASLSAYEQGIKKPSFDVILDIAQTFDVSTDWLFGLSNNENTKITEVADVVGMLIEISKATKMHVRESNPESPYDDPELFGYISFEDQRIDQFLLKWHNISNLWQVGSIDDELYDLWCQKEIDAIRNNADDERHTQNGNSAETE